MSLVSGNVGIGTSSPSATLTVIATNNTGSRIQLGTASTSTFMDANKVNDFMVLTAPFGNNPASVSNAGAKWGIKMNGSIDGINTKGKAACIYAVSEDGAGYNRTVGMALHTSGFDLDNAERVRITNGGYVGIGTSTTTSGLQIQTEGTNTASGSFLFVRSTNASFGGGAIGVGYQYAAAVGNNYTPFRIRGGSTNAIFTINSSGTVYAGDTTGAVAYGNHDPYYTFNQDTNTGMDWAAADTLTFKTGGTERLRIDTNGNVGIGTTVQNQKLSIYPGTTGGISLQDSGGTTRSYFFIDNTNPTYSTGIRTTNYYIDFDSSGGAQNAIRFYTGTGAIGTGTERMRVTGTGNIGIGTSSPISKLNAYASGSNLSVLKIDGGNGTLFEVTDQLSGSLFSVNTIAGLPVMEAFSNNRVVMGKYNANDFVISGSRVGIGTVPNNSKLHIYADHVTNHSVVKIQTITSIASGGVPSLAFFDADGSRNTLVYVASDGTYLANEVAKPIIFSTNGTEKMRILSGGNVGIGTSSPSTKLHVYSSANQPILLQGTTAGAWMDFQSSTSNLLSIGADGTNGFGFYNRTTSANLVTISNSGNVGIGTTAPVAKLHTVTTTAGSTVIRADGTSGTLFSVVDDLSDSLMSVNNSAGLPVFEVFANDRIVGGQYGVNDFVVINNKVGIGTNNPSGKLHVSGSNATSIIDGLSIGRGSGNVVTNTVIGNGALLYNTTGASNSAFGYQAMAGTGGIGPGAGNCAFGFRALKLAGASCSTNCAFGGNTLASVNYYAINNNAFGFDALRFTTGGNQNAFGYQSLYNNTTGSSNSAFGHQTLRNNTTGSRNSAFGYLSLYDNTTGSRNSAFGYSALRFNTAGSGSVAFGHNALRNCTGPSDFNVAIGALSLFNASGPGQNTAVGYKAGSAVSSGANLTIIGYNAAASTGTATNEVTLGNSSVATLRCQVTTITALSDFRDKTDINNVGVGLSFVEKLRPVTFKWDKREWYTDGNRDGSKKDSVIQAGFIAQELKALQEEEGVEFLKLVYESNPDKLEATPGNLMIPLIKAVQELSAKVKTLEAKVQILESK